MIAAACVAPAAAGGCAPEWLAADADREVLALLSEFDERVLGDRAERVVYPETLDEPPAVPPIDAADAGAAPDDETSPVEPLTIDLARALEIGFTSSRDFQDQAEALYLQGLGFTLTQYNFGLILDSTIDYIWSDAEDAIGADRLGATLGARQILPTGGQLSLSSALGSSRFDDPRLFDLNANEIFDSSFQVSLRQPLLRDAGYEVSHEALTQGERSLVYAVRSFELFRQDFSIRVAEAYYRLVSRKQRLRNDEQAFENAVFDRKKAEALRQVDRNRDEDVILARRREVEQENALLVSRTNYELAIDDFKILLGLPTAQPVEIVDHEPAFEAVRVVADSAVDVALVNRLDLHTERDRLEDQERQVRLAKNDLLPAFDLNLGYAYAGDGEDVLAALADEWSGSVGLSLEVPLDRKSERNSYRATLIGLERARRDLDRFVDVVERDILSQVRELDQIEKRIELQRGQIESDRRGVAVIRIQYEAGDVDARALLDARQGLTDAQNALIDLKVDHFLARLRLQRDLGVFFVDEKGMWRR